MICSCCGNQKAKLTPRKSSILPAATILVCQTCKESKMEPRYLVILVGRSMGPEHVREQILKRLYCGKEILGSELIT